MSSILNSANLIRSIRRRGFIPRDQSTFSDEDFLEMATEEINIGLMEQIIEARGDYLVVFKDVPIIGTITEYSIPSRAHGNKLRAVCIVDSSGKLVNELTQIQLDQPADTGTVNSFFMRNNKVVLNQASSHNGEYIRMSFYIRPNKLVVTNRAATIATIGDGVAVDLVTATKILSFATLPTHFTSSIKYDITGAESPNKIMHYGLTANSINLLTKTISFIATDVPDMSAGDFITLAEETIVPNVPTEYHPVIAQRVAVACLEAMGDEQNKVSAERKLLQMEKSVLKIVTNRVEGSPKKIRQRNGTLQVSNRRRGW